MRRLHIGVGVFLATFAGLALADPGTAGYGVLSAMAASAASAVISSAMAKKPSQPQVAAPVVEKPTTMPTPDGADAEAAKKKSLMAQIQRQGRASTILTGDTSSDKMG